MRKRKISKALAEIWDMETKVELMIALSNHGWTCGPLLMDDAYKMNVELQDRHWMEAYILMFGDCP